LDELKSHSCLHSLSSSFGAFCVAEPPCAMSAALTAAGSWCPAVTCCSGRPNWAVGVEVAEWLTGDGEVVAAELVNECSVQMTVPRSNEWRRKGFPAEAEDDAEEEGRLAGSVTKRRRMKGMEATGELVSEGEAGAVMEVVLTDGVMPDICDAARGCGAEERAWEGE